MNERVDRDATDAAAVPGLQLQLWKFELQQ
jgi:hypothetical protein